MNALEKVEKLRQDKEKYGYSTPYLLDITPEENAWKSGEIEALWKEYPWLPQYYIDFIRKYDSLGLAWVVFYGSEGAKVIPIREELDYWKDNLQGKYFPIGKDAGGNIYVLNHQGAVLLCWLDDLDWEEPEFIAKDLEEFIGDCILGKRYSEFDRIENNNFYTYLQKQGWCP